jgi:cytochrome c biogenesis protein CcmG/thiol:disulfide interchange protein DsbE
MPDDKAGHQNSKTSGWGRIFAWIFVIGLLLVLALQLMRSQESVMASGALAPEFVLTSFDGQEITSEALKGKVVLINFWASWCKPCEQEAPELQQAWELFSPSGEVEFLGIDYVDTTNEALVYIERFSITYPNGPDLGTRIAQAFRIRGVPETFFLNKEGEIAFVQIGPFTSIDEITKQIDLLLEN